jgi:hypothetical protein
VTRTISIAHILLGYYSINRISVTNQAGKDTGGRIAPYPSRSSSEKRIPVHDTEIGE